MRHCVECGGSVNDPEQEDADFVLCKNCEGKHTKDAIFYVKKSVFVPRTYILISNSMTWQQAKKMQMQIGDGKPPGISVYCDTCGKEIFWGYVDFESALSLNMTNTDLEPHQSHHLLIRDKRNIPVSNDTTGAA